MYSFTRLDVKVDHVIAGCDRHCSFCQTDGVARLLPAGSDYYLIKSGKRTHRRRAMDEPTGFRPHAGIQKLDRFCVCPDCWLKFGRILGRVGSIEIGGTANFGWEYSFRQYASMHNREYRCECCSAHILGSTQYWRIGHYRTFCLACHEQFSALLGRVFSY